ncbi:hypothetical protein CI109_106809 [Kwoniella shandongensis]|uniref:Uncharacterized protein n=1 Tax=Kwoniella shandongensis TaxID=1734106 RepID=A0A5M6C6K0_9TREE|nr:uncharacterized protein CI109_000934 [Kwoniella shandongensis]KAA5530754.1 hypothetical protein CI109_000934 [Kwoniella shandongensis]
MSTPPQPSTTSSSELPWAFIDCPLDTLIVLLAHMLDLLITHNDQVVLTPDALTRFHSRAAPGITVVDYLRRIVRYTNCEKIPLLSLLSYIDITCLNLPTFTLSSLTVHRFLIASVCAGSKAQCDVFCTNAHYAKVGGIKTNELNALERELLRVTKWDLCCHADTLQKYYTSLIRSHGGFTQASPPPISPFMDFPRSRSKPRPATADPDPDAEESDMAADDEERDETLVNDEDVKDEDHEMTRGSSDSESSPKGQPPSEGMMAVDPTPEQGGSSSRSRGRTKQRRRKGEKSLAMDIDPTATATAGARSNEIAESPYSTSSSSSIPSSSRSSIRGGGGGGGSIRSSKSRRGRTISVSVSNPKLAEPKVDVTPIMGVGSFGDNSKSSLDEREGLAGTSTASINGTGTSTSTGHAATTDHPTTSSYSTIPIPTSHNHHLSPAAATATGAGAHNHNHPSSHSHGRSLKSLVGGIFRRKSLPGDDGILSSLSTSTSHPTSSHGHTPVRSGSGTGIPTTKNVTDESGHGGGGSGRPVIKTRPHSIIPSKPIHVHLPSFTSSSSSSSTSTSQPSGIAQTRPQPPPSLHSSSLVDPTHPPVANNATSPSSSSLRGRTNTSPPDGGFARPEPVTPRVRHRDETSMDSPRDRVNLGSAVTTTTTATAVGLGIAGGGTGAGAGVGETGLNEFDSGKRSRGI